MIRLRKILVSTVILASICSCEEVIKIDLNDADPAFVAEAIIYKDSVCTVHLTRTISYFSPEEPEVIEDAIIKISDGSLIEELSYTGNGYYTGSTITGIEGTNYEIEIMHKGISYQGISYLPRGTDIISISYARSDEVSIFNPNGDTIYTIDTEFIDDPDENNFYMIRFILDGEELKNSCYVLTEENAVNGYISTSDINHADNDTIRFSEWMFFDGGEAEVQVFSIDETTYNYFLQLNDVLYWKRRFMPPAPYNPKSNISNGALGYFAAWTYDSREIVLE